MDTPNETTASEVIHSQVKEIIYNVNTYFLLEKANGGVVLDPSKANARTAKATKVSESTVTRICSKWNRALDTQLPPPVPVFASPNKRVRPSTVTNFDDYEKCALRRTVLGFYEKKEIPTLAKITKEIQKTISYHGCANSLHRILLKIGFTYVRIKGGQKVLVEKSNVVAARTKFLKEIQELKKTHQNFVYLGETWVSQKAGKCPTRAASAGRVLHNGKGNGLVVIHAGTEDGFVDTAEFVFEAKNDGMYNNTMNSDIFEDWFRNHLVPNITANCVIVMDSAPYHCRETETLPNSSWKKAKIKEWLFKKGAQLTDDMMKAELLELVQTFSSNDKKYVIDRIAREAGHRIVRIPPHHYQYNPLELIWTQVRSSIPKTDIDDMEDLELAVREALSRVTAQDWMQAVSFVENLREEDAKQDLVIDQFVDSLAIKPSTNSDSDDDDDELSD